jgi:hypothetical protein
MYYQLPHGISIPLKDIIPTSPPKKKEGGGREERGERERL